MLYNYQLLDLAVDVAEEQFGLVTKGQLSHAGMTDQHIRDLITDGALSIWDRNIYKVTDHGIHPFPELMSVHLSHVDRDGWPYLTFGYQTSLAVLELISYNERELVHVYTEGRRGQGVQSDNLVLHVEPLRSTDLEFKDGLRITNLKRTLIDLFRGSSDYWPLVAEAYHRGNRLGLLTVLDLEQLPRELTRFCERYVPPADGVSGFKSAISERHH